MSTEETSTSRIHIENISPAPDADVIVAIGLALDSAWPEPSSGTAWQPTQAEHAWRFAQRPWTRRSIPRRNW